MKKFDTLKKLLGVMIIMLVSSAGFAQWNVQVDIGSQNRRVHVDNAPQYDMYGKFGGNALVIDTRGGRDFTVMIDNGYTYNSNGGPVKINSLYNGDHKVTIYEKSRGFFGGYRQRIIFNGKVCLKPGTETSLFITGFGQVVMNEKPIFRRYDRRDGDRRWDNNNGYDRDNNVYDRRDDNGYDRWNK